MGDHAVADLQAVVDLLVEAITLVAVDDHDIRVRCGELIAQFLPEAVLHETW